MGLCQTGIAEVKGLESFWLNLSEESVKFCWKQFMIILSFFMQNFSFLSISFLLVAM